MNSWNDLIAAAGSFGGWLALLPLVLLGINLLLKNKLYKGRERIYKILNSILVLAVVAVLLLLANSIISTADRRIMESATVTTESTGTETLIAYNFEHGSLYARVSALNVAADADAQGQLWGNFSVEILNRWNRALKIRDMQAITRGTGKTLQGFDFTFERAAIGPGQDYPFSGRVRVSPELFNDVVRKYDMALRVVTDGGSIELPFTVYTLDAAAALAAGLITTNQVSFGDSVGVIDFLNCEQSSAEDVCEQVLQQMGAAQ
jgi:hypothetical protein